MIITCPSCGTNYLLPIDHISAEGKNVKCAKCKTVWFEKPSEDKLETWQKITSESAVEKVEAGQSKQNQDAVEQINTNATNSSEQVQPALKQEDDNTGASQSIAVSAFYFIIPIVLVFFNIVVVVLFWADFLRNISYFDTLYNALGIYDTSGLIFNDVSFKLEEDVGVSKLLISGMVRNISRFERNIPNIRIKVIDDSGNILEKYLLQIEGKSIKPGADINFTSEIKKLNENMSVLYLDLGNKIELIRR